MIGRPDNLYDWVSMQIRERSQTDQDMPVRGCTAYNALRAKAVALFGEHGYHKNYIRMEMRKLATLDAFFTNCFGHVAERDTTEKPGDARVTIKAMRMVWGVLKEIRELVEEDDYKDLYSDKDTRNMYARALLLHVPFADVADADLLGRHDERARVSDPNVAPSLRAAQKLLPLTKFAAALGEGADGWRRQVG